MRSHLFIFYCFCLVRASLSSSPSHHHREKIMQMQGHLHTPASSVNAHENVSVGQQESEQMLAQRLNKLKEIVKNLNAVKPAAYLTGGYYFSVVYHEGELITDWNTRTSGLVYPSVLQGGMTYSDGYIIVPETGVYFIYFTMFGEAPGSNHFGSPYLNVDSLRIGYAQDYFVLRRLRSQYLGKLWKVEKGSRLSVRAGSTMDYYFYGEMASFGAWKVD
ncbi:uncharacterized protein [Oscarella lobularis]|uniref:uncharacterized protein isoform X2 n=1 Tax=Oscarella lobularis TaxID=121494 RepID=UPI003313E8A8